jgi:hypothetical protein
MSGGLGFRDLECFIKALLVKQCWRLIQNLDSFAVKMLKVKYYPTVLSLMQSWVIDLLKDEGVFVQLVTYSRTDLLESWGWGES